MPGRFPLLTDENITGPLIQGLRDKGWDVVRTIDVFGERSVDEPLMIWSVEHGRVLVTTDTDCLAIAHRWLQELRSFRKISPKEKTLSRRASCTYTSPRKKGPAAARRTR